MEAGQILSYSTVAADGELHHEKWPKQLRSQKRVCKAIEHSLWLFDREQ